MESVIGSAQSTWKYLRFFLPVVLACGVVYAIAVGPANIVGGILLVLLGLSVVERLAGEDFSAPNYAHPKVFVYMMWAYLPITLAAFTAYIWVLSHGAYGGDLLGIAAALEAVTGFDMMAAHGDDGLGTYLISTLLFSLIASIGSVSIGHELSHRTWEPVSVFCSRACSLFGLFTYYAIEHPYGHHYAVGTPRDSSTALRGESIYRYFLRTTPQDYEVAWEIETERLAKLGLPAFSWHNRLLWGWGAEAALIAFVIWAAGLFGLFWYLLAVLNTHFGYKLGTYGQHYGIIRVPGSEIKSHHSWDSYNTVTNWLVDNIGRHSQHHLEPSREFWRLQDVGGPRFPGDMSYTKAMGLAIIPSRWHRAWSPLLIEWDQKWASPEERALAREANIRSGRPELMAWAARMDATDVGAEASATT